MSWDIIMGASNLLILLGTLFVAFWAYKSQRAHNFNSVRPILQLDLGDYEDDIYVRIYNNGVGPGIIKNIEIKKYNDGAIRSDIIGYFENLDWEWDVFNTGLEGLAISPNCYTYFIEMKFPNDFQRERIRRILKDLHIKIEYIDIYNNSMEPINTSLDWFGRDPALRKTKAKRKQTNTINISSSTVKIVDTNE